MLLHLKFCKRHWDRMHAPGRVPKSTRTSSLRLILSLAEMLVATPIKIAVLSHSQCPLLYKSLVHQNNLKNTG